MSEGVLILRDYLMDEDMTFDFTPEFEGGKVAAVTATLYEGRLTAGELEGAEPSSIVSLDTEGWATLLSWVRAAFEAKKI